MLPHYLIQIILSYLLSDLLHGHDDVILGDGAATVGVKLVENSLQMLLVQEWLHVHCGNDELSVINLVITLVVYLVDNPVDFRIGDADLALLDRLLQLSWGDHVGPIFVYSLEIFLQVFNLILVGHLYQHVGCCLLQFADAFVLPKPNQNIHIELRAGTTSGSLLHALKPIVL